MSGLLLDTCALIYLALDRPMRPAATQAITEAARDTGVYISPASAWEMALLAAKGRFTQASTPDAIERWYHVFLARPGVQTAQFTTAVAFDAVSLPDLAHSDPIDRFLIATARHMAVPLVTSDQVILTYAAAGHVQCIAC